VPGEITRVLSDLHYGDRVSQVRRLDRLRPLLEGIDHLILNGDTLDTRPGPSPARTADCRAEVLDFFRREAPSARFLTGNHDADLSSEHRLDLAAGEVFVTHGDIVFDDIVPWSRDAALIGSRIAAALARIPDAERGDLDRRLAIWRQVAASVPQRHQSEPHNLKRTLHYFADTVWPPSRFLRILQVWRDWPRQMAALARLHRPEAGYVLTGHIHRPLIWHDPSGVVVINTGSFCPPLGGCLVDLSPGRLTVRRIERSRGGFRPGRVVAEFALAGKPSGPRLSSPAAGPAGARPIKQTP